MEESIAAILVGDLRRDLAKLPALTDQDPVRAASKVVVTWRVLKNMDWEEEGELRGLRLPAENIKYVSQAHRAFVSSVLTLTEDLEKDSPRTKEKREESLANLVTKPPGSELLQVLKEQLTTFAKLATI